MLKSQRKKGVRNDVPVVPFPNFGINDGDFPTVCTCVYDESSFLVSSSLEIQLLYSQGGFGRSTLTMRAPICYSGRNYQNQAYFKKATSRPSTAIRIEEFQVPQGLDSNNPNGMSIDEDVAITETEEMRNSADPCVQPDDSKTEPTEHGWDEEALELMPEEVIFLTFGVGCLKVVNPHGIVLMPEDLWTDLVTKNPEFPIFYAVYHYFRCKNWVPKSGENYGGDYVLYEVGPEFNHALYVVHILGLGRPRPTWLETCARQRCASHASKCALFCEVVVPENFCPETPMSIFDLNIKELPIHRWTVNQ